MCVRVCMYVRVRVCVCRYNYIVRIIRDLYFRRQSLYYLSHRSRLV